MDWMQAVLLGLVQGVTEFLPISSSAHLILTSYLLGWEDQGLAFDMAANSGSLVAVIACFAGSWRKLAAAGLGLAGSDPADRRLAGQLLLATVPVAVAGLAFQGWLAVAGRGIALIAATTLLFGLLLDWADRRGVGRADLAALGWRAALAIGLMQALALVPGTSRSGVTITAALLVGLSREAAVRFSFLLAVPVGLLVAAKDLLDLWRAPPTVAVGPVAVGFVVSAVAAYAAIRWLLGWVRRRDFRLFVVYRVALGLALLAVLAIG